MTPPSQCQCCVCSSSCRMAAAVDTTAVVPQFLARLSPAFAPADAAAAAAVCCWCWCCSYSLLCMFLKCAVFVVLTHAMHGFFTTRMCSILSPIGFFACHSCVDSQMSVWICAVFSIIFRLFLCFFYNHAPRSCKVEFQSFNRLYSQLTLFTFFTKSCFSCVV